MNKFESSPGEPDNKNVGDVDWSILLEPTDDPTDDEPTDPDALAGSTDDPTDDEPPINPDEWAEGKSDVPNFGANPDLGGDISEENFYDGTEPTIVPNEPSQEALALSCAGYAASSRKS